MNGFEAGDTDRDAYTNTVEQKDAARVIVDAFLGADPLKGEVLAMIFGES